MNDDSTRTVPRTWTRGDAAHAQATAYSVTPRGSWAKRPAGWLVRMQDGDGRAVAAGPSADKALALAREFGHGEGRHLRVLPTTATELDALLDARDLSLQEFGIGEWCPWWRKAERPVYRAVFRSDHHAVGDVVLPDSPIGSTVSTEALVDEVDGVPVDELSPEHYVYEEKHGRLVGWLKRERAYSKIPYRYETIPYFFIAGYWHEVTDCDDVALAIVERWDGRYLPSYPRCPDCGGAVKWAEAGPEFDLPVPWAEADQGPGSRKCTECESRFVDTRYDHIFEGWRMPCPHCDGCGHVPRSVAGIEDDES